MFMRLFQTKASESLEKGLAGAIYKEENRRQIEPLTTWQYKLTLEKPLQKLTINVAQSWIKQDRDRIKIKKATAKTDQTTWKRLRYTILSATGQYQSSLGLLGKPTNMQNIYYCKIINGSYMVWPGKVWLLRKINRKEDKDYIKINIRHVCSYPEARRFWLMNEMSLTCFPKAIAFISKYFNWN